MLLGALFTEEKNKKNVNINDRKCHLCRNKDESITHLFVECEKIVNSMAKSNINYLTFKKIIHMEKLNLKDRQYLSLFKFAIWRLRNAIKFDENKVNFKNLLLSSIKRYSVI